MKRGIGTCLFLAVVASACAGNEFTSSSKPSAGAGGKASAKGGAGGATDPGAAGAMTAGASGGDVSTSPNECQQSRQDYLAELAKSRLCSPNVEGSCQDSATLTDACGCEVPVNPTSEASKNAKDVLQNYLDSGCPTSGPACAEPCPAIPEGSKVECQNASVGGDNVFTCQWAL